MMAKFSASVMAQPSIAKHNQGVFKLLPSKHRKLHLSRRSSARHR